MRNQRGVVDAGMLATQRRPRQTTVAAVHMLWWREIVRFARQRSRMIGAFAQPIVFWLLLGGGFNASFHAPGAPDGGSYLAYFYPGIIVLTLLFTAIFATIAVVEDRQAGFLQGVLVAPVSRSTIVLGQSLGCTTLAVLQGGLVLLFAPLAGIHLGIAAVAAALAVQFVLAFGLSNVGLVIAWRMDSTQGFHAIMNLILIPIWLLSGAVFPVQGASAVLAWIMRLNPLTYGVAALRQSLHLGERGGLAGLPPLLPSLAVVVLFGAVTHWAAARTANRGANE